MADKKLVIPSKHYRGETMVVSVRLPSDLVEEIDKIVEKTGRNRNEVIQKCLIFSLENLEIKD